MPDIARKARPVPPLPVRVAQRVAMKAGLLTYERGLLKASGPPRLLIRVDEFPHYLAGDEPERYGTDSMRRFHETLTSAGAHYLMAIVPRVPHRPLDPNATGDRPLDDSELELLAGMARDGVTFGLHGYNHRTRFENARRRSELCGLSPAAAGELLDRGLEEVAKAGIRPRVFVPPYNRFDAGQWDALAERFDVICGGPESVPLMGFHPGPQRRGGAVYLPCYPPLYGSAEECLPVVAELVERQVGAWVPIVLHPGWELDDTGPLTRFGREVAPYAASWEGFLSAVDASK